MNDAVPSAGRLAVVLKGWPRLSETFIAQELVALEQRGLRFEVWSMRHPTDKKRHALHDALKAKVRYLPEYLYQEPLRVLKGRARSARLPGFGARASISAATSSMLHSLLVTPAAIAGESLCAL